jgi:hypothetical protein
MWEFRNRSDSGPGKGCTLRLEEYEVAFESGKAAANQSIEARRAARA